MQNKKKIILTGGGSSGHVTLNLSLIPPLLNEDWEIIYIGSINGIEKELLAQFKEIKYYPIQTGKLRRYLSFQNFMDLVKVFIGIAQSFLIIKREKPNIIFSKGGFVSFPVVFAGWLNKTKTLMHESDVTTGLANKLALPFVDKLFTTFETAGKKHPKYEYIGPIVPSKIKQGNRLNAIKKFQLDPDKPMILFMGGSLGAKSINNTVRKNIPILLKNFQIIHLCGKGQLCKDINEKGYIQLEYVNEELADIISFADVVVSRAGSNSIFELLSIKKPMVLIPLPETSSRGEQSLNANMFKDKGYCEIIKDEDLNDDKMFINTITNVYKNKETYIGNMITNNEKISSIEVLVDKIKNHIL